MKTFRRKIVRFSIVGALVVTAATYLWWRARPPAVQFVTAPVTRGAVVRAIVTTGAVNPVVTVQVGTYVSGVIQALYCDYNTQVKSGQLCAKIDPRPYQVVYDQDAASLASAEAQLRKDRAALVYATINEKRDRTLRTRGIVSQDTVDNDRSTLDQSAAQVGLDEATIQERRAALHAAQVNLDYTNIVSPVDGIVVSRSVDVGQTVAASFQTPTLFLIAKDLTKMQVDTNVSESDVGAAKVGEKATFTVESYPNEVFEGRVTQVRQAPITVQNVVTYDVVVSVANPNLELLPGMTANTRIISDARNDVLRVPLPALKFSPPGASRTAADVSPQGDTSPAGKPDQTRHGRSSSARVWILRDGRPQPVPVTTGLSDGSFAEISAGDLKAGDEVIVNQIRNGEQRTGRAAPPRSPLRL